MRRLLAALILAFIAFIIVFQFRNRQRPAVPAVGPFTLAERLVQIGPGARQRLNPAFEKAGISYPPTSAVLVAFKRERRIELHASESPNSLPTFVATYPILGQSGRLGPKLREGDHQIPEGFYRLLALNPNSRFHVSIRVDYPNEFDLT
ncbi:MAG: hypothetical protein WA771_15090, partial [Chthoniobacterales bacterium]